MIRVAHFSDLHYCEKHLEWVDRAMGAAVEEAIIWKAQLAVLSGDSFDSAITLHHPAVAKLLERVRRLAMHMPVFILQGTFSHDRPGCLDVFKHMRSKHPIFVGDTRERAALIDGAWETEFDPSRLSAATTAVVICSYPSLNRADVQLADSELSASSYVDQHMQAWAQGNLQLRTAGIPTILVTHGTIIGCETESKQAMVSQDHEFSAASLFSAQTSAVMIGHIHAHQGWEFSNGLVTARHEHHPGVRRIAYPGSITRLIYGHDSPVGMLRWEVSADEADYSLFETPNRRLIDIEFDGPPDIAELGRRLASCRGAFVRLRYSVDEEHRKGIDDEGIRQLLENAGLGGHKTEPRINPVQRTRSAGISTEKSTEQRLKVWCELTGSDAEPLLDRLHILQTA